MYAQIETNMLNAGLTAEVIKPLLGSANAPAYKRLFLNVASLIFDGQLRFK